MTPESTTAWFSCTESFLSGQGFDIADLDASRFFNLDETGVSLQGNISKCKVLAAKGSKVPIAATPDKSVVTSLFCISANGIFIPPMVFFAGVRMPKLLKMSCFVDPGSVHVGKSSAGWMEAQVYNRNNTVNIL